MNNKEFDNQIIQNLSEADFLSFLYSERNRENDLSKYQGWNIWVLVGALVTVIIAGYNILVENHNDLCMRQVMYCVSFLLALFLCYKPLGFSLERRRVWDRQKVKSLKDVTPKLYLWFSIIISATFSILILLFDFDHWCSVIFLSFILLFVVFAVVLLYNYLNRNKIVLSYFNEMIFTNYKWEPYFACFSSFLFALVWYNSFLYISKPLIGVPDFELSVCITSFILLFYLLIMVWNDEKDVSFIDRLIDEYIYKNISKETIFRSLRIKKMGNTVLEACDKEWLALQMSFKGYEQKLNIIENINRIILEDKADIDNIIKYSSELNEILLFLKNSTNQSKALINKMIQIGDQAPELKSDDYNYLLNSLETFISKTAKIIDAASATYVNLERSADKLYCEKYCTYCDCECELRHEKPSRWMKFRSWLRWKFVKYKRCKR